jgi:hypothetical protein
MSLNRVIEKGEVLPMKLSPRYGGRRRRAQGLDPPF